MKTRSLTGERSKSDRGGNILLRKYLVQFYRENRQGPARPRNNDMRKPIKYAEKAVTVAAGAAWVVFDKLNQISPNPSFTPKWSDKPLLKSWEKQKPKLGWPRETDSLCPKCIPEIRQQILDGKLPVEILRNEKVGEIKAKIIEKRRQDRDGEGVSDPRTLRRPDVDRPGVLQAPGRRFPGPRHSRAQRREAARPRHQHHHPRPRSVLTIDLTNRCNMMCDPCFMDANQVGFVHELSWEDIKTLLDNAISIKPRRQLSVQFSGGEPTLSPYFLDAVRYCRKIGYQSVQAATNGIEFAKRPEFAKQAAEAGSALRVSAVRRHRQRSQLAPRRRQPVRREAARHRESVQRRRRHRPGDHADQRRQQ